MRVIIAKVDENLFDGEAESLTVPGAAGEMTVLGEHMPLITTLKAGNIIVRLPAQAGAQGSEPKIFPVTGGVIEVRRDGATIIL